MLMLGGRDRDTFASAARENWREMFSEELQRLYYADAASSETSWKPPPFFRFSDWRLGGCHMRTAVLNVLQCAALWAPPRLTASAPAIYMH